MPDFKLTDVDTVRIVNTVNSINDDIKEIAAIEAEIRNNIIPTLDQCWQSQAKQSFDSRASLFLAGYTKILEGYELLNEQLRKAGETYESANDTAKQIIAKLPK